MVRILFTVQEVLQRTIFLLLLGLVLSRSDGLFTDDYDRVRAFVRRDEFEYVQWVLNALATKNTQAALDAPRYLSLEDQKQAVFRYLDLVARIDGLNREVATIYADPAVKDPETASREKRTELEAAQAEEARLGPLAESILQAQVSTVLASLGLTTGGQPLPPVLYRVTPLPYALIVSPRERIEQEANISLVPGLSLKERIAIEEKVARSLNKSTLVVGIGGVGVYPTMVQSTSDLNWLTEVVAHEWTHNYLTLRPLGMLYDASPEMRTINETTASIAGKEIGRAVVARFYPEKLPPEEVPAPASPGPEKPATPPSFDFRKEMRITRLQAEALLAEGKIEEAEAYMEARRKVFWEHGYLIRKLNQAYFAFYGAYNDTPGGGAAGEDPVGPAVQALRQKSASLAEFLNTIARVTSFEQLQQMVK
ncbi:hypothetical protein ATHL_03376 [Anaerolinea thermolimosa]|uniref:Uncharacterized protein n=1 Tax=Anaerolinea thermolimosa TaxID=229919 RepID=A0A7U9KNM5_9CHLR|nr:hypothetical protein [Anaerolinea thermolimosa]GAP08471.1 hypothetical protein ATHL_03376 [Anaerolinea thermolimosa]